MRSKWDDRGEYLLQTFMTTPTSFAELFFLIIVI